MSQAKIENIIKPISGYPQPIGVALWRMYDSRERTLKALEGIDAAEIDWQAHGLQNHIGTLLYHIATVEIDWLYDEILQQDWPEKVSALLPHPMRNTEGHLFPVPDLKLEDHLMRLHETRQIFLDELKHISLEDFYQVRMFPRYDVTPDWALHHLAQHEDEHRGEITTIRTLYKYSSGK